MSGGTISQGAKRGCGRDGAKPSSLLLSDLLVVKHHPIRHLEAALFPGWRECHVNVAREQIGEVVEGKRCVMGEDTSLFRPEPEHGEFFMVRRRKMNEAIYASSHADHAPCVQVVHEQLR